MNVMNNVLAAHRGALECQSAVLLRRLLENREARVGVIGLGYVGLPLVTAIASAGYSVFGFDIDAGKINELRNGRSYITHIPSESVASLVEKKRFVPTTDMAQLNEVDVIVICVPTPLTRHREPDLSFITNTAETIAPCLRPGQLIVLESTTYPGTTREVLCPILERTGLRSGDEFFLAYSPEREDPGNANFTTSKIPKVVGGDGETALELATAFYSHIVSGTVAVSTVETAEAVKLTENIFRAINIALVNELKLLYEQMGIDIWEVIEAAKTKPFGYMPFYPGPGLGGHCLPIDPFYLTWKAREYYIATRLIELAGEINTAMPLHVVERLAGALNERSGSGLKDTRILVLGIAYKKDVDDIRESPALRIMDLLLQRGAVIDYHDPYVSTIPVTRGHLELAGRSSVPLSASEISRYSAVLVCTDHSTVDYDLVADNAVMIVDTRNVFGRSTRGRDRIVRA